MIQQHNQKYIFQKKQRNLAKKIFTKGLNATGCILLSLKETGEMFLEGLPDSYPGFKMMKEMTGTDRSKNFKFKKKIITANLSRLKKQGLIIKDPIKKIYYLTPEGKECAAYIKDRYEILKNPWDKKFRVVIFDIPESKKRWRRWIRQELLLLQFQQLQQSVYIGKYPLPESFYQEINKEQMNDYIFTFTMGEVDKRREILKMFEE